MIARIDKALPGKFNRTAFILLEVMLSIMIIGVTFVAILRGFIVAYDTLGKVRMNETAILLARSVMDDMILEPFSSGDYEGRFADDERFGDDFAGWYWEVQVENEEPRYSVRSEGRLLSDLEELYFARVIILYDSMDDPRSRAVGRRRARVDTRQVYVDIHTILMEPDIFSLRTIERNQLY